MGINGSQLQNQQVQSNILKSSQIISIPIKYSTSIILHLPPWYLLNILVNSLFMSHHAIWTKLSQDLSRIPTLFPLVRIVCCRAKWTMRGMVAKQQCRFQCVLRSFQHDPFGVAFFRVWYIHLDVVKTCQNCSDIILWASLSLFEPSIFQPAMVFLMCAWPPLLIYT